MTDVKRPPHTGSEATRPMLPPSDLSQVSVEITMRFCSSQEGQAIAEYGAILALILVLVVGTVRLVGHNANSIFSSVTSSVN
jgi:Flp pilus assembly pilin Flp